MEDSKIIDLYWARSQQAVTESECKYGAYCRAVARNILLRAEDAEECVNDTWLRAWNAMPPQRPTVLQAFFGALTRNLSLDRWRRDRAEKRGGRHSRAGPGGTGRLPCCPGTGGADGGSWADGPADF